MTQLLTGREIENAKWLKRMYDGPSKPKADISTKCYLTAILITLVLVFAIGFVLGRVIYANW